MTLARASTPDYSWEVVREGSLTILTRAGALPGSADWTHEYAGPANTLMSRDTLVKAPLGILWYAEGWILLGRIDLRPGGPDPHFRVDGVADGASDGAARGETR